MLDLVPPPPPWLYNLTKPYADALSLPTLSHHIHEVIFAFVFYQTVQSIISPVLSTFFFPRIYPNLATRTRINWDVHVVSLVQSCVINTLALWVMWNDEERSEMKKSVVERVYGYTGASGLIQGLATGYFLWDLVVSTRYFRIFGPGIWAHAVTALCVFSFGFRPFCNYYGPVFILYELSSPFLNVHWFCDKLNLTGSKLQWYNGMLLLFTFFMCRLVWGTYSSLRVYQDVWAAIHLDANSTTGGRGMSFEGRDVHESPSGHNRIFVPRNGELCLGDGKCIAAQSEVMKFTTGARASLSVPVWLAAVYLVSNLVLNSLNFYWFGKMIETVRKRFEGKPHDEFKHERDEAGGAHANGSGGPPLQRKRKPSLVEEMATSLDHDVLSGPKTPAEEKSNSMVGLSVSKSKSKGETTAISDGGIEVNRRRKDLK